MTCKLSTQKVESARKNTCSCICYSWHLNMMFCPSFSKDFIICGLSTPFPCREVAEKKKILCPKEVCAWINKTHSSVSTAPLQWLQKQLHAQALALWIWEIAVGTIKRIIWTQSDHLSTQTSSGRNRSEELTSLLLHSDQNSIPAQMVCRILRLCILIILYYSYW